MLRHDYCRGSIYANGKITGKAHVSVKLVTLSPSVGVGSTIL